MFYRKSSIDIFVVIVLSLLYFLVNIILPSFYEEIIAIVFLNVILISFSVFYHIFRNN